MSSLSLIAQANSKDAVAELFEHVVRHRHNLIMAPTNNIEEHFNIKSTEAANLVRDVYDLIRKSMASGLEVTDDLVKSLFHESIDPKIINQ